MFRKIHSNRDRKDTVYSELKKEFRAYFETAGKGLRALLLRYPKLLFGAMVMCILVSVGLSLTVFRAPGPVKRLPKTAASPFTGGFDRILQVGSALRETIWLEKLVDSLTAKKSLNRQDSVMLEKALDRLQQMTIHPKGRNVAPNNTTQLKNQSGKP